MHSDSRISIRLLVVFTLMSALAACSGDDGAPGPQGSQGPAGPAGPPGPPGPSGAVPVSSADRINITVNSVTIPTGGGNPVVELALTNDLNQGLEGLAANEIRFMLSQLSPATAGSGASSCIDRSSIG